MSTLTDRCEFCDSEVRGENNILDMTTSPARVTCKRCLDERIKAEWEALAQPKEPTT